MARWVATFEDIEDMLAVRKECAPAHLAYLGAHKDKILITGRLRPAPGEIRSVVCDRRFAYCSAPWLG